MTTLTCELPRERLLGLLEQFPALSIGVVGDLAIDAYWYAEMQRSLLSRETPHFPRPIIREAYSPGAGANVAADLAALGVGHVEVLSVIGKDWRGELLRRLLTERAIATSRLIISESRKTTAYIKPMLVGYASQQEDARLDFENDQPLSAQLEDALTGALAARLGELDAVFIADQLDLHGVITARVREAITEMASLHPECCFVADSRHAVGLFRSCVIKPNRMEAQAAVTPESPVPLPPGELAATLHAHTGQPVYVTLSEDGALVYAAEGRAGDAVIRHLPAGPVRPPLDPVGAGDAFGAALVAALAAGASPFEAGAVANLAAAVTVEKLATTGTTTPEELVERYDMAAERDSREAVRC